MRSLKFSVFLVKASINDSNDIIEKEKCLDPIEVPIRQNDPGELYLTRKMGLPRWLQLFSSAIDFQELEPLSSLSGAFVVKVSDRIFVISFGQGGRFLLRAECYEERFGLIVALNSVDKNSFRCVDKKTLDSIQSHTRTQAGKLTSADRFGLDVEQDILRAIVGNPQDKALGSRMTGTESLTVSVPVDLDNLPNLLLKYRERFEDESYKSDYPWVNNISEVRKPASLIEQLDSMLVEKFRSSNPENLWLSIPEILPWESVMGFMYTAGKKVIYPDISYSSFMKTIPNRADISLKMLHTRKVMCADGDHNPTFKEWKIYNCIYTEIDINDNQYILSDGKWFKVNAGFVERTNAQFGQLEMSSLQLPEYSGGSEGAYNKQVTDNAPDRFALMDDKNRIFYGNGMGQVEFCDLFSREKQIIHIKRYGKSSVLSHLFAQGFVSGRLFQVESEFRKKVVEKLPDSFKNTIEPARRPLESEYTIIYGIITPHNTAAVHMPFFSRVNLNNAAKTLKGFGYKVELLNISVNRDYLRTKIAPPGRTRT